jgi:hypothetical protein
MEDTTEKKCANQKEIKAKKRQELRLRLDKNR